MKKDKWIIKGKERQRAANNKWQKTIKEEKREEIRKWRRKRKVEIGKEKEGKKITSKGIRTKKQ